MFAIAIFILASIAFIAGGVLCYALCQASSNSNKEYENDYKDENFGI